MTLFTLRVLLTLFTFFVTYEGYGLAAYLVNEPNDLLIFCGLILYLVLAYFVISVTISIWRNRNET